MPVCVKCKILLPPGFVKPTQDQKAKICLFCIKDKDKLEYYDKKTKQKKFYSKKETEKDYKKFINQLSDKSNVKKIIFGDDKIIT